MYYLIKKTLWSTFAKIFYFSLKTALAYTFIFLYITAMLRPVMPLANYLINQDYIAEFLCINKDLPELGM